MTRRFQFSLKTLLGLTATVCLLLGGWHLLETYGTHFDVTHLSVGKPFRLNGRYVRLFGPSRCRIELHVSSADPDYGWTHWGAAERSWLCCYDFDWDLEMLGTEEERPGDVTLEIGEIIKLPPGSEFYERFVVAKRKTLNMTAE